MVPDPWYDLIYHALACVPADVDNPACLYDPSYAGWVATRWPVQRHAQATATEELARVQAESAKGFLLQSFPLLWADVPAFLADREVEFEQIVWPTPESQSAARALGQLVHPGAVRLFRRFLTDQVQAGFVDFWRSVLAPMARAYRPTFLRSVEELARREQGLLAADWVLSVPMGRHGRLMSLAGGKPKICVGVGDAELGVPDAHPVIQACHEFMLAAAAPTDLIASTLATVPGQPGYERFLAIEGEAARRAAKLFAGEAWRVAYAAWLSH